MPLGTKHPTVSFIVPNYNYGHFLGECLESAVRQTYSDWEIIIIDDSSTDNSREIAKGFVERYPERIRLIELSDGPGGPPRAINTGIRAMRGRYFSWLSSDDRCHPERLSKLVSVLDNTPSAGMVHTAYTLIDNDGKQTGVTAPTDYPGTESFYRLLEGNIINGSTVLVRKELLDEIGPLLETHPDYPDLLRVSEYILWLDVSARAGVALAPEALHDYRIHNLNVEYNTSSLGPTMVQIAKRFFLKKHGMKKLVSWLCSRSGAPRSEVYARLASILAREQNAEDVSIFLEALVRETPTDIAAVAGVGREIQRRENHRKIMDFYLATNAPVTRHVFESFTEPTAELEQLTLKCLNRAKAEYKAGNLARASRDLQNLLGVTRFFPSLDLSARYYLGLTLEALGQHDAACDQFDAVLKRDPNHSAAASHREQLFPS